MGFKKKKPEAGPGFSHTPRPIYIKYKKKKKKKIKTILP